MARRQSDLFGLDREEKVRKQKLLIIGCIAAVLVLGIVIGTTVGLSRKAPVQKNEPAAPVSTVSVPEKDTAEQEPEPVKPAEKLVLPKDESYTQKATILCTGDNLIHEALYADAESEDEEGYYDFRPIYRLVKPLIEAADVATVNMETPLATSIGSPSGYPHFNSPRGAGYALLDAGFDVINHANNHIMDMGTEGIVATLNYWADYSMPVVGAYRNDNDMYTMRIVDVNGIKIAFLGFAEFTNYDIPDSAERKSGCRFSATTHLWRI